MRNRTRFRTLLMIPLAISALGLALPLLADEQCSLRRAVGDWEYTVTELENPAAPPTSVGSFHVGPDGHLRGTQTLNLNGSVVRGEILTGTVKVNADCTGSTDLVISNTPFPRTAVLDITWENGGTKFHTVFLTDAAEFDSTSLKDAKDFNSTPITESSQLFAAEGKRISHRGH